MASSPQVKKTKIQTRRGSQSRINIQRGATLTLKNSVTLHSPPDMKYHNFEHKQENA